MAFSSPGWLFIPFAFAGLILAFRHYRNTSDKLGRPARLGMFLLLSMAWLALLWLWTRPYRTRVERVFHPPAVVFAVDRSQSFSGGDAAWLQVGEGVRRQTRQLSRYYGDQGFRIHTVDFGEFACEPGKGAYGGDLTRLSALRKYLDSAALPNLQGIFLWSDGRFNLETDGPAAGGWSAPIFPVLTLGAGSGEVQGEILVMDFSRPDSGVSASLEWSCLQPGPCKADLELFADGIKVWSGRLSGETGAVAARIQSRIRLPRALRADGDSRWRATLRPEKAEDNRVAWNDTLQIRILGGRKSRNFFPRPVHSLEERGLMDALRNSDSSDAVAAAPESLGTAMREGDVVWLPRGGGARMAVIASLAEARGRPVIFYAFADIQSNPGNSGFSSEARKGRSNVWDATLPRLWSTAFQAHADVRLGRIQEEWVQGIANRARAGKVEIRMSHPRLLLSQRPFFVEGQTPISASDSTHYELSVGDQIIPEARPMHWGPVRLPAGNPIAKLEKDGHSVWTEELSVRDPSSVELGLLGIDGNRLAGTAQDSRGEVIRAEFFEWQPVGTGFPKFSAGQIAEEKIKSTPLLSPGILGFITAMFLCALWVIRKLSHLD